MEREEPAAAIDPARIGQALGREAERRPEGGVFEYHLPNEPVAVSLRLSVDPRRRTASLYLRGTNGFLGFVHLAGIQQVQIDEENGEVSFTIREGSVSRLAVQRGGVFIITIREA